MVDVKIVKLSPSNNKIKSKEDVLIADLTRFYNDDMNYVKTLISTVLKRNKKQDKIEYASETSKQQLQDFIKGKTGGKGVTGPSQVSLRVLDWFVTNYTKKNDTGYYVQTGEDRYKYIFVHRDYKAQLDSYSKRLFDPFCRRSRIILVDPFGNRLKTTVAQLNFFRWVLENKVIEFIQDNQEKIEKDMKVNQSGIYNYDKKKGGADKKRKPRQELSVSATKKVTKHDVKITVTFD